MSLIILTISFFHHRPYPLHIMSIFVFSTKILLLLSCPWTWGPGEVLVLCPCVCQDTGFLWLESHIYSGRIRTHVHLQKQNHLEPPRSSLTIFFLNPVDYLHEFRGSLSTFSLLWMWNRTWSSQSTLLLMFGVNSLKLDTQTVFQSIRGTQLHCTLNAVSIVLPIDA